MSHIMLNKGIVLFLHLTQFQSIDVCKPKIHFRLVFFVHGWVDDFKRQLTEISRNLTNPCLGVPCGKMCFQHLLLEQHVHPGWKDPSPRVSAANCWHFFWLKKTYYHSDSHNIYKIWIIMNNWSPLNLGCHEILPLKGHCNLLKETEFMTRTPIRSSTSAICLRRWNKKSPTALRYF